MIGHQCGHERVITCSCCGEGEVSGGEDGDAGVSCEAGSSGDACRARRASVFQWPLVRSWGVKLQGWFIVGQPFIRVLTMQEGQKAGAKMVCITPEVNGAIPASINFPEAAHARILTLAEEEWSWKVSMGNVEEQHRSWRLCNSRWRKICIRRRWCSCCIWLWGRICWRRLALRWR